MREGDGRVELQAERSQAWPNADFTIGYSVWNDSILASCNVQLPTPQNPDPRGSFVITLAPPNPKSFDSAPRSVVFLLDRSGSMDGDPIEYAKRSLILGLQLLK